MSELADLIAEQEKDDKWGTRANQRGLSLDYTFEGGGSFSEVVGYEGAGGDTALRRIPRPHKWTKRQIISHIRAWAKEHGVPPKQSDWNPVNGRGFPSTAAVTRHFGTWGDAIRAAGYEPFAFGGQRRPDGPKHRGKRIRKPKRTARLTPKEVAAAYLLYSRKGLTLPQLGELLYEKYGYPTAKLCKEALNKSFHAEGFRLRTKSESRLLMSEERRRAITDKARAATRWTKLTADQRAEIFRRRGIDRQVDLAAEFGVSQHTISRIQRGAP